MKTGAAGLLMLLLLVPITRQFFLPFLPIATWLFFFFNARYVSYSDQTFWEARARQ